MKGFFVLQRRFLYIGHELAIALKERGVVDEFCAYVQLREGSEFLKSQKDISYTRILLDEDLFKAAAKTPLDLEYLKTLEKDIGSLWTYIDVDRIVRHGQGVREYPYDKSPYTYEEILRIVQTFAKEFTRLLEEEKPDFVYMFQPGSLGAYLMYAIAKKHGIPVFLTEVPSMKNLVEISESCKKITSADRIFLENLKKKPEDIARYNEAKEYVTSFRQKPFAYASRASAREKRGRLRQFSFLMPSNILRSVYFNFFHIFWSWLWSGEKRSDFSTVNPFLHLWDRARRKVRNLRGFSDLYDAYEPSRPFAFFPLQYEPELNVLINAPWNIDQREVIRRLARSLPVGMYLYVKEHPQMVPYRRRSFYKEIKKIPNVKLIDPARSGNDLMMHAQLVATISGSAGWEATLLGKPVIAFGENYYNTLPSILYSNTPEELPTLVARALERGPGPIEEAIRFAAALLEVGATLDLMYLWEVESDRTKKQEGLRPFVELLARKIQELKR